MAWARLLRVVVLGRKVRIGTCVEAGGSAAGGTVSEASLFTTLWRPPLTLSTMVDSLNMPWSTSEVHAAKTLRRRKPDGQCSGTHPYFSVQGGIPASIFISRANWASAGVAQIFRRVSVAEPFVGGHIGPSCPSSLDVNFELSWFH